MALTKVSKGLISTSIVDNGNATAITIDSAGSATFSNNVGIGSGSGAIVSGSANDLLIEGAGNIGITIGNTATGIGSLFFADPSATAAGFVQFNHNNDSMAFGTSGTARLTIASTGAATFSDTVWLLDGKNIYLGTDGDMRVRHDNSNGYIDCVTGSLILRTGGGATEKMRIDASGRILIGKTVADSIGTDGIELDGANDRVLITRSDSEPLVLNRKTSDGDIAIFRKDGGIIGRIGAATGPVLYTVFNDTTSDNVAALKGASRAILPSTNAGADKDGTMSLGGTGARFKDLHLSGGVVFGDAGGSGTSSSNTLDSYEEGTWTPVLTGTAGGSYTMAGINSGNYVKVGNLVYLTCQLQWTAQTTAYAGNLIIDGFPFVSGGGSRSAGTIGAVATGLTFRAGYTSFLIVVDPGRDFAYIIETASAGAGYSHTPTVASAGIVYGISVCYII